MGPRSFEDDDFPVSKPAGEELEKPDDVEVAERFADRYEWTDKVATPVPPAQTPVVEGNEVTEEIESDDDDDWDPSKLKQGENPLADIEDDDD